ncbi:hypothetical protein EDB84DRAFT_1564532 [Lactarius hengduanensis]|nr:hypothetical protein EDB84DRAFT_1564532 [Lactarius hengduanensis]
MAHPTLHVYHGTTCLEMLLSVFKYVLQYVILRRQVDFSVDFARGACDLSAQLGTHGVGVFFVSNDGAGVETQTTTSAGPAPRLQTIYMSRVPFPAAPTLFLSAHDLVDIRLCDIPPTGYIPPEAMVASLAVLPRLEFLTFEFDKGMSYPDQMCLLPITRTVLPALTTFYFKGLSGYFEDFVAQIDVPQLDCLQVVYLEQEFTYFQITQLCNLFDRSGKFHLSRFVHASIFIQQRGHGGDPPIVIDFRPVQLSLCFCVFEATGRAISQLSAILSNVTCLSVGSFAYADDGAGWLELFHPFTSVKTLRVEEVYSPHTALLAFNDVTQATESAAELLPALELLCLVDVPVTSTEKFVATRQNMGRPVTVLDEEEFKERMNIRDDSE